MGSRSFWQRFLSWLIVSCYLLYNLISVEVVDDPIIDMGENVNVTLTTEDVGTTITKPIPIIGKVPTCTTPQNDCVKPYFNPEKVACLVKQRQTIDSSGAWLLPPNFMYKFDQSFANAVLDRVISGSVLELGAGLGCYTSYFHDSGKISSIDGYEGAANVEAMSEGFIKQADLTKDLTKEKDFARGSFDWVVCMEVAEHIPAQFQYTFLLNIVTPARKGILLSWGLPGQIGIGHVNTRSNEYVIDIMKGLGFDFDEEKSNYLRNEAQSSWFKGSTMVFLNTMYEG